MELSAYLLPLRKWWWLLLAATAVAAISSFIATSSQSPLYQSRTTLLIGTSIENPNPTTGELTLAEQLASIYADIAMRDSVRRETAEALGLDALPQYNANALEKSQIIEIMVIDTVPVRAQAVAQELANQLISLSPMSSPLVGEDRSEFIDEQLNRMQEQINETEAEIEDLQIQLGDLNSAQQIQETGQQILALQTKLTTLQSNYAALLENTQQGANNTVTIIEPANLPFQPINQNSIIMIFLASAIGLSLAALAAYGLEYLDKSIRSPEEISQILDTQVIGFIPKITENNSQGPFVLEHPVSSTSEAFRSLRINIEFAASERLLKTIFLTSADVSVGKTTVSANLAIMLAQGGHKVILVDADLRRPAVQSVFGIPNTKGLAGILKGEIEFRDAVQSGKLEKLEIITAGRPPSNPAELLASEMMDQVLVNLNLLADYVILDGPPLLIPDAAILASKVDGVLMVVQPGKTPRDLARSFEDQIERVGTPIIGVVFNQIPRNSLGYYGRQWYYSPYYVDRYLPGGNPDANPPTEKSKAKRSLSGWITGIVSPAAKKHSPSAPPATNSTEERKTSPLNPVAITSSTTSNGPRKPPKAKAMLRWEETKGAWRKLVLREGDNIMIGRDQINDVTIQSRHVSRRHAVITWRKDQFEIADLGSTNGTMVNGMLIDKPFELKDGDKVRLFDVEIIFENLSPGPKKAEMREEEDSPAETEGTLPA